jgi:hypothetical protein
MKLNKLKQIIKEEILGEIKVNKPLDNREALNKMLDGPMDSFVLGDNLEEWRREYTTIHGEEPSSEITDLAEIFYQWLSSGDIIFLYANRRDELFNIKLTKSYNNLFIYGGEDANVVYIILTTF